VSARPAAWLAWSLWLLVVAFGATSVNLPDVLWFWYVLTHYLGRPEYIGDALVSGILVLAVPAYATVGALVASLRPKNGVGWLCLFLSLVVILGNRLPTNLADLAFVLAVPPLPVTLMLLIFPDGRLSSRRWWAVVGAALGGTILTAITVILPSYPAVELAGTVGLWASLAALLASVVALVLRWRRSRGQERQQIKLLVSTRSPSRSPPYWAPSPPGTFGMTSGAHLLTPLFSPAWSALRG
jgi:hypothetical protein